MRLKVNNPSLHLRIGNPGNIGLTLNPAMVPVLPDPYAGPYTVTPRFSEQVLETAEKSMADDVTVLEIPVHRVSNEAGGVTVSIGG